MGTVSVTNITDGTTADAADVNSQINAILAEFNGGIDNTNIDSAAAIAGSKLADNSINLTDKASSFDGWIEVSDSWSYASATTVTVPTDAATKYSVGDKIKFDNSSTKYFYIVAIAATTLTLSGGTDYTVANSAISAIYYSKAETPLNFPASFNYSPTITGFSANPTNTVYDFFIRGSWLTVSIRQSTGGTSNAATFTITAPVVAATVTNGQWQVAIPFVDDNSATLTTPGRAYISTASSTITLGKTSAADNTWTTSGTKRANFQLTYRIA